jgi:hypothetical protein
MLSRVPGLLASIAHFSERSTQKNDRGDTVADAINSRAPVPLSCHIDRFQSFLLARKSGMSNRQ